MEHHAAELLLKKLQDGVSWDDLGMMKKEARQLQLNKSSWHRKLEQAPHRRTLDSATKTPGTSTLREPLGREKPTSSAPLVDNSSEIQLNQKAVATSELHEPGESKLRVQERTPPPRKVTHTKDTSLSSKELPVERPPDYDTWEPWMQKKWEWQHARVTYKRHDQSPIYHYDEQERDQAFIPEVILKSWKTISPDQKYDFVPSPMSPEDVEEDEEAAAEAAAADAASHVLLAARHSARARAGLSLEE